MAPSTISDELYASWMLCWKDEDRCYAMKCKWRN